MSDKDKNLLNELKGSVPEKGDAFDVEIPEKALDTVSGGAVDALAPVGDNCLCMCGAGGGCGGSGSG